MPSTNRAGQITGISKSNLGKFQRALEMREQGMTLRAIADKLTMATSTLTRWFHPDNVKRYGQADPVRLEAREATRTAKPNGLWVVKIESDGGLISRGHTTYKVIATDHAALGRFVAGLTE